MLYLDRHDGEVIERQARAAGLEFIRTDRGAAYRKTALIRWLEGCASWCADPSLSSARLLSMLLRQWEYFNASVRAEMDSHRLKVKLVAFLCAHKNPVEPLRDWLDALLDCCLSETFKREPTLRDEKSAVTHLKKLCASGGQLADLTVASFGGQAGSKDHLNLITLYSAKGLEFDVVMMMGMDQGRIPRYRASDEEKAAARRLFYVGLTRARHEVHLLFSGFVENRFGRFDNGPSTYVIEVYKRLREGK